MFCNFVSNSLRYHKLHMQVPDASIAIFKFDTDTSYSLVPAETKQIDEWLSFAVQSKVKELDLIVQRYCLPLLALNASSLIVLRLCNLQLKFEAPSVSTFPPLKALSLKFVESETKSLQNLISGCPVVEDLDISRLSINLDFILVKLLKISNQCLWIFLSNRWLEGLISGLPLLEKFILVDTQELTNIRICTHSLISLSLHASAGIGATCTTSNLVFSCLTCCAKSMVSVEAPNLFEATLRLWNNNLNEAFYVNLVCFLSNLNGLMKMMLSWDEVVIICSVDLFISFYILFFHFSQYLQAVDKVTYLFSFDFLQDVIFLENIRNTCSPPLPSLKHLEVNILYVNRVSELRDSLLWCAPSLETFDVELKQNCKFLFLLWLAKLWLV